MGNVQKNEQNSVSTVELNAIHTIQNHVSIYV